MNLYDLLPPALQKMVEPDNTNHLQDQCGKYKLSGSQEVSGSQRAALQPCDVDRFGSYRYTAF